MEAEADEADEARAGAGVRSKGYACVPTPGSALQSTGVWKRVLDDESVSGPECDCRGMYSPRPCPAIVGKCVEELGGDDERLRSGDGDDRGGRGPRRSRGGAGGTAGASDVGDEARDEFRRLPKPEPSFLCTMTTGNAAGSALVSCAGSVSAVIAVWRLALACMGGANGSSLEASYSAPLLEDVDGDDDDDDWVGEVGAPSRGFCTADDPALPRLLDDDGDRAREEVGRSS